MFIGRERELSELNELYAKDEFQLFVLYGRRRVGKTTLLNEFCKEKDAIFYSAEQRNNMLNLEKFSALVFQFYGETTLETFSSWENALTYIDERQKDQRLILVFDEFPYLVKKNRALLSSMQHLIDHRLKNGKLFLILCGSYMGFMEKEVLGVKSPLFGRRTGQLHMKPFDYQTSIRFLHSVVQRCICNRYRMIKVLVKILKMHSCELWRICMKNHYSCYDRRCKSQAFIAQLSKQLQVVQRKQMKFPLRSERRVQSV